MPDVLNKQIFTVYSYSLKEYIDLYVCFMTFLFKLHVWSFCNSELVSRLQNNVLPHWSAKNVIYTSVSEIQVFIGTFIRRGSFALSIGIQEYNYLEIYMNVNVHVCNCMNFTCLNVSVLYLMTIANCIILLTNSCIHRLYMRVYLYISVYM